MGGFVSETSLPPTLEASKAKDEDKDDDYGATTSKDDDGNASSSGTNEMST